MSAVVATMNKFALLLFLCFGAYCVRGMCPLEKDGECARDNDCKEGYVCKNNECICEEVIAKEDNRTSSMSATESLNECETDDECGLGKDGICANGTCIQQKNDVKCDANFEAIDNICICKEGYSMSEDGKSCLKRAEKLGENCTSSSQCEEINGTCNEGICSQAVAASAAIPDQLSQPVKISSTCSKDADCNVYVENSICRESICQCGANYIPALDDEKCLPLASNIGDPCEIDKQCSKITKNAFCSSGVCSVVATASVAKGDPPSGSPTTLPPTKLIAIAAIIVATAFSA